MQASDPLIPRAVPPVRGSRRQPGNGRATAKPSATAGLDRPCARTRISTVCRARDEGTALGPRTKELGRFSEEQAMT